MRIATSSSLVRLYIFHLVKTCLLCFCLMVPFWSFHYFFFKFVNLRLVFFHFVWQGTNQNIIILLWSFRLSGDCWGFDFPVCYTECRLCWKAYAAFFFVILWVCRVFWLCCRWLCTLYWFLYSTISPPWQCGHTNVYFLYPKEIDFGLIMIGLVWRFCCFRPRTNIFRSLPLPANSLVFWKYFIFFILYSFCMSFYSSYLFPTTSFFFLHLVCTSFTTTTLFRFAVDWF
jgi:hypothetical protein